MFKFLITLAKTALTIVTFMFLIAIAAQMFGWYDVVSLLPTAFQ